MGAAGLRSRAAATWRCCRGAGVSNGAPAGTADRGALLGRFSQDRCSYISQFSIRGYEAGPDRKASMVTIANLLQENATHHAVALWGVSEEGFAVNPAMVEMNLIFAMTRLQIQMTGYPNWGDRVDVETWFDAEKKAAASRDFLVSNSQNGEALGRATSIWVCINTKTRRLSRIPDVVREQCEPLCPHPPREAIPKEECRLKIPDIDPDSAVPGPSRFAGHMDLDMNGHINNVTYLVWALDLLPDVIFESHQLHQVEIDFKWECNAGDRVEGSLMEVEEKSYPCQKQFVHSLFVREEDSETTKELVRVRSSWT